MKQRSFFVFVCFFGSFIYLTSFYGFVSRHMSTSYYDVTNLTDNNDVAIQSENYDVTYQNLTLVVEAHLKNMTSPSDITSLAMTSHRNVTNGECFNYFDADCNASVITANQSNQMFNFGFPFNRRLLPVKSMFTKLPDHFAKNREFPVSMPGCLTLQPWKSLEEIKSFNDDTKMIYVIKSGVRNVVRRNLIRASWGSIYKLHEARYSLIFVVGLENPQLSDEISFQHSLEKENEQYGDILQCSFIDTYKLLPIKVLSAFNWLNTQKLQFDWVTVTDDDCLMNVGKVYNVFEEIANNVDNVSNKIFCGFEYGINRKPIREKKSKWYIKEALYNETYYPTFCHGGMWTLNKKMLHKIVCASQYTEIGEFYLEDVFITGILRRKVTCSDFDVLDVHRRRIVRHISGHGRLGNHLVVRSFVGFWRIWNSTLPWKPVDGVERVVELRGGIPKLPHINSRLEALKQMRERRKEFEEVREKGLSFKPVNDGVLPDT